MPLRPTLRRDEPPLPGGAGDLARQERASVLPLGAAQLPPARHGPGPEPEGGPGLRAAARGDPADLAPRLRGPRRPLHDVSPGRRGSVDEGGCRAAAASTRRPRTRPPRSTGSAARPATAGQGPATSTEEAHGTAPDAGPPMTPAAYLEAGLRPLPRFREPSPKRRSSRADGPSWRGPAASPATPSAGRRPSARRRLR